MAKEEHVWCLQGCKWGLIIFVWFMLKFLIRGTRRKSWVWIEMIANYVKFPSQVLVYLGPNALRDLIVNAEPWCQSNFPEAMVKTKQVDSDQLNDSNHQPIIWNWCGGPESNYTSRLFHHQLLRSITICINYYVVFISSFSDDIVLVWMTWIKFRVEVRMISCRTESTLNWKPSSLVEEEDGNAWITSTAILHLCKCIINLKISISHIFRGL